MGERHENYTLHKSEEKQVKRNKIALALVEQCKSEGGMTVQDLMEIFKLSLHYINIF